MSAVTPPCPDLTIGTRLKSALATHAADDSMQSIVNTLAKDGVVIIEDLLDQDTVNRINGELDPIMGDGEIGVKDNEVVGQTRRLNSTLRHAPR